MEIPKLFRPTGFARDVDFTLPRHHYRLSLPSWFCLLKFYVCSSLFQSGDDDEEEPEATTVDIDAGFMEKFFQQVSFVIQRHYERKKEIVNIYYEVIARPIIIVSYLNRFLYDLTFGYLTTNIHIYGG